MTDEERAEKQRKATSLSQAEMRKRESARNQDLGKAQGKGGGDGEQDEASASAARQGNPPNFHLGPRNPRNLEVLGFVLPIRLPSSSEHMRWPVPPDVLVLGPRSEVNASSMDGIPSIEEERHEGEARPIFRLPLSAVDTRTPWPLEANVLLNLPQEEKTGANGPDSKGP